MVGLSRSAPGDFSRGEDRLADAFEHLLLVGGARGDLQDRLSKAASWCEGTVQSAAVRSSVEYSLRNALELFLQEGHIPHLFNEARRVADGLRVRFEGQTLNIDLPTEIRAWFLSQTPSMISF